MIKINEKEFTPEEFADKFFKYVFSLDGSVWSLGLKKCLIDFIYLLDKK